MESHCSINHTSLNQSIVWVPCIADYSTNSLVPLYTLSSFPSNLKNDSIPKISRGGLKSPPWTSDEDEKLKELVELYGKKNWAKIAKKLNSEQNVPKRKGKHCRERWYNHLNPELNKGEWTFTEDIFILKKQLKLGNKWSIISKKMKGRTENAVKNRWNCLINSQKNDPNLRLLPVKTLAEILITQLHGLESKNES